MPSAVESEESSVTSEEARYPVNCDVPAETLCADAYHAAEKKNDKRHTETCSGCDAEYGWPGKRIAEDGLEHQSGCGETCTGQKCCDSLWHTAAKHYVFKCLVAMCVSR